MRTPEEEARQRAFSINRRHLMATGGAVMSAGLAARQGVLAQDATPDDAVGDEGGAEATPAADTLPAAPPEFADPLNWPVEGLDLSMTRNVQESGITAETVGDLGLAWSFPVTISA